MSENKIFSPSAIKVYSECPVKYELKYVDRWLPRQADKPFWGTVAGDGFDIGSSIIIQGGTVADAQVAAHNLMLEKVELFHKAGGQFEAQDLVMIRSDVSVALTKFAAANPFERWKEILAQVRLPEQYGKPRLDIVGLDHNGVLSFADIKFKRYLDTQWVQKTVEEYRYDWQFLHYAWAMEKHYGKPVNAYLCLVRLKTAWQAQLFEFVYDPELIRMTGLSVARWSEEMQRSLERGPALGTSHETKFGPCPYKDACLKYKFDDTLMQEKYIQVERII